MEQSVTNHRTPRGYLCNNGDAQRQNSRSAQVHRQHDIVISAPTPSQHKDE